MEWFWLDDVGPPLDLGRPGDGLTVTPPNFGEPEQPVYASEIWADDFDWSEYSDAEQGKGPVQGLIPNQNMPSPQNLEEQTFEVKGEVQQPAAQGAAWANAGGGKSGASTDPLLPKLEPVENLIFPADDLLL